MIYLKAAAQTLCLQAFLRSKKQKGICDDAVQLIGIYLVFSSGSIFAVLPCSVEAGQKPGFIDGQLIFLCMGGAQIYSFDAAVDCTELFIRYRLRRAPGKESERDSPDSLPWGELRPFRLF